MSETHDNPALSALRYHVSGAVERGEAESIIEIPVLTALGRSWAEARADKSIVARIALAADAGEAQDWPVQHRVTAIQSVNAMADRKRLTVV